MKKILFIWLLLVCNPVYANNLITFIVPYAVGGGTDRQARIVAKEIEKKLSTTVIVENKYGANGLVAINYLLSKPRDGKTILYLDGENLILNQILDSNNNNQLLKLSNLGGIYHDTPVLLTMKPSNLETIKSLKKFEKTFYLASSDKLGRTNVYSTLFCYLLDLNCKVILGYPSGKDLQLALRKKEITGLFSSTDESVNFYNEGLSNAVTIFGNSPSKYFSNTPTIHEIIELTPEDDKILKIIEDISTYGRSIYVPFDTPEDIKSKLKISISNIVNDENFIENASKMNFIISYTDPNVLDKIYKNVIDKMTEKEKIKFRKIVLDLY
jgi:tripartite-type tricarboxylate transporter receptor subunit TctC